MRICIVQPIVPAYRVPVFTALAQSPGIDLEVWADLRAPHGSLSGVSSCDTLQLHHAAHRKIAGVYFQPDLLRAIRSDFDVVVVSDNVRSPGLWCSWMMRKSALVLWGHGYGTTNPRFGDALRYASLRLADAAIFYSQFGKDRWVKRGIDSSKLFVAPNAIDQSSIIGAISAWNQDRLQEFCLSQGISNRRTMLFLSRLEPEKRPELAVEALERLRSVHPEILLAFIGDGSSRPILEAMVRDRGLSDSVRFLGAIHDQFHIAPWALSSELLIHPGALGLTILHAFGYGLPVVTTNDKSIQMPEVDALVNGLNGLEYQDGNVGDLVACCSRLLSDSSLRARMSIAATKSVTGPGGRNMTSMVDGILAALSFAAKSR